MSAAHTPGPWRFDPADMNDDEALTIGIASASVDAQDEVVGQAIGFIAEEYEPGIWSAGVRGDIETVRANARLIAAAPELLSACRGLLAIAETGVTSLGTIRMARAAIEKAIEGAA